MRDYGNALLQYRKIAGDRSEKNMKYANNAMEFTGISSFMVDWTRKETEQEIDRAYLAYSKLPLHHRYWLVSFPSFLTITNNANRLVYVQHCC